MKRSVKVFGLIGLYLLGWWSLWSQKVVLPSSVSASIPAVLLTTAALHVFRFLPIYTLILFGVYSVVSVMIKVSNFKDCPEAAKELDADIAEARTELKSKGFKFD